MRWMRGAWLVLILLVCAMWTACSTNWVAEAEQIVAVMIPGIANVLTLIAALQGKNVSAQDVQAVRGTVAQAEADLNLVQSLVNEYQKADAKTQAGLLIQIQSEMTAVQGSLGSLLPALHIKDTATQAKIVAVLGVLAAELQSVQALIPPANASGMQTAAIAEVGAPKSVPLTAEKFVKTYNATMTAKTGQEPLDNIAGGLGIHLHGKFVRIASVGILD
jgi:hypothetical protein